MSEPKHAPPPDTAAPAPGALPLVRVVDDEPTIQALFRRMATLGGFEVATWGSGRELLDALDDARPGCLVIDLVLPDLTGIEVLEEVSRRQCQLPVVFMSGMARVAEAVKALKLGSVDFLEKPFDVQTMIGTLQRAIALDQQRRAAGADREELRARFQRLTRRETEVMEQIVQGAANKEVAARLGLSPKTVEVHRANVMRKTRAGSLAELVRMHVAMRG
jgi:two-component system, LuxR family, response regulator FixJ